ncbi:hypothetical protein [Curtobacterium sp. MCBD17_021]|uniref:hypothetical protein n=1 Tax=Curtobacterium sp. MCBD17_021 TaxID=2175665 RepID=UPI002815CA05|nr:hypothetical protein [Curtobacterium sp. MCBD17_021]
MRRRPAEGLLAGRRDLQRWWLLPDGLARDALRVRLRVVVVGLRLVVVGLRLVIRIGVVLRLLGIVRVVLRILGIVRLLGIVRVVRLLRVGVVRVLTCPAPPG